MDDGFVIGGVKIDSWSMDRGWEGGLINQLTQESVKHGLKWLLAHADDGVIWGEMRGERLWVSSTVFPGVSPPLRPVTLRQARFFSPHGELLLWRASRRWQARLCRETDGEIPDCYDESHLLWGDYIMDRRDGFALLRDGQEGLRHSPPVAEEGIPPFCLTVRHYFDYDADGQAFVAFSRLISLSTWPSPTEGKERCK
ncbi:MAG: CRISPR-associated protein Csx19 [Peptococcaceae bacterium]|jgi:CRISPR-associated protein (TIGR03984 family)|nr:CRISPR-associated protein Csx19 [Peptococcaceae bacterium]